MIQQIESLKLSAQPREKSGSRQAQRLRKNGWLPGIVYNSAGKSSPIQIKCQALEVLLRHRQGQNLILDLEIEGDKARKVLLKDVQQNRINDHLLHVDFLEVSMTRKLKVSVPVTLVGEPVGVTQQGGVMEHLLRSVEVECLPGDIIKEFVLDVSALSIGDTLSVRDIKVDPKITVLTMPDIAVVSVQIPHFEEEKKPVEEAVEGAVEGVPPAEGAEAAAAEPGKEKGKETKEKGKETKEAAPAEKDKEAKEKGKESKEKGKETKDKAKSK